MLICEVLQFGLGRQLFAGLPMVTEAIAGPCKNMCSSSSEKLQPFQQIIIKKKKAKIFMFWCYGFHQHLEEECSS